MGCCTSKENYKQAPFPWKRDQNKTLIVEGKRCFLLIKLLGVLLRGSSRLRRRFLLLNETSVLSSLRAFY